MSQVRFNHVYLGLLALSLLSAFVIAPRFTDPIRSPVQGIFFPVARPARALGAWVREIFSRPDESRPLKDVAAENQQLRAQLASLTGQLEYLRRIDSDRELFGEIGKLCTPVAVAGSDPGARDCLILQGALSSKWIGRPVLHVGGLAGRIERAAMGGGQVRLISDPGFYVKGHFARLQKFDSHELKLVLLETTEPLVEGVGKGALSVRNLKIAEVMDAKLQEGDWLILDDPDWPPQLKYQKLGQIVSVRARSDAALMAEIRIQPPRNLLALDEVMVFGK